MMNPDEMYSLLSKAEELEATGSYDEAERLALEILDQTRPDFKGAASGAIDDVLQPRADSVAVAESADITLARAISIIGSTAVFRGNYEVALEHFTTVLSHAKAAGDRSLYALAMKNFGRVHHIQGDYHKALDDFELSLAAYEELRDQSGIGRIVGNMGNTYTRLSLYSKALEYQTRALTIHRELGSRRMIGANLVDMGQVYSRLGVYHKVLDYYTQALAIFEEIGEKPFKANVFGNIGIVYSVLEKYDKALEYYAKALALQQELGAKASVAGLLNGIGNVLRKMGSNDEALEYQSRALRVSEELGLKPSIATATLNLGNIYAEIAFHDKALEFYIKALGLYQELGSQTGITMATGNIGFIYSQKDYNGYDAAKAEEYLLEGLALSEKTNEKLSMVEFYKYLDELYTQENRWEDAHSALEKYIAVKLEVQSRDAQKKADIMEQQMQTLRWEQQLSSERAEATATQNVLHRVLPASIASRLIKGEVVADYFPAISILFADIVGFTPISANMPAHVVVRFLNFVFAKFDQIMKEHGCEKIKTIGDGYMAVAGAPIECVDHAERIAHAALAMQEDIHLPDDVRRYFDKGTVFTIRIGIHTGSAVGGIIGDERFVYDVYSDAVNLAARMESSGEPGKIHVSSDFAMHLENRMSMLKEPSIFTLTPRGEIDIKGKGMMRTYFLERA